MTKKSAKRTTGVCPKCKKVVPCSMILENIVALFGIISFATVFVTTGDFSLAIAGGFITLIVFRIFAGIFGYKCDYCGSRVKKVR